MTLCLLLFVDPTNRTSEVVNCKASSDSQDLSGNTTIYGTNGFTCLLEPCSTTKHHFLQRHAFQCLLLLVERSTLEVTSFSFFTGTDECVEWGYRQSQLQCQDNVFQFLPKLAQITIMSLSHMTSASYFPYFSLCYEITFSSQFYLVCKTYYVFPAYS
jgi:hypothetical protein